MWNRGVFVCLVGLSASPWEPSLSAAESSPTAGYAEARQSWGSRSSESFRWRGRVDGVDDILIRGNAVRIDHLEAQPIQNQDYAFSSPLPGEEVELELNVIQGRGRVRILQQPSRSNDYTAIVRVDDGEHTGASDYEFELVWQPEGESGWGSDTWQSGSTERFQWSGRVDGVDDIVIRGESVRVEHVAAQPVQKPQYRFSRPLPSEEVELDLNVIRGRGQVRILEQPSRSNDYAAIVRVDDSRQGGASDYAFELYWESAEESVWSGSGWSRGSTGDFVGSFHWKGRVDVGAEIEIRASEHQVRDAGGTPTQEMSARFKGALPSHDVPVSLEKRDGRGKVTLIQTPSRSNDYTAIVRIEDPKSGSDTYAFELGWYEN